MKVLVNLLKYLFSLGNPYIPQPLPIRDVDEYTIQTINTTYSIKQHTFVVFRMELDVTQISYDDWRDEENLKHTNFLKWQREGIQLVWNGDPFNILPFCKYIKYR